MTALKNQSEDVWGGFCDFAADNCNRDCDRLNKPEENSLNETSCALEKLPGKMAACILKQKPEFEPKSIESAFLEFEEILQSSEIWQNLVNNCELSKSVQWSGSKVQSMYSPLEKIPAEIDSTTRDDLPPEDDDMELRKLLDMHSLFLSFHADDNVSEPSTNQTSDADIFKRVQTADEVIEEIEEILLNADEQDAAFDDELEQQTGIIIGNENGLIDVVETEVLGDDSTGWTVSSPQDESDRTKNLKRMSFVELNEELSQLEGTVKYLSESLLKELNLRDELLYEKEVRSTFISKILEVQQKQEQFQQNSKTYNSRFKFGKLTKSFSMSNASVSTVPGRFLTTVIPFDEGGVPSMESLQALIKLLDAIKADSSEVPSLITDYILKVLCPAPTGNNTLKL